MGGLCIYASLKVHWAVRDYHTGQLRLGVFISCPISNATTIVHRGWNPLNQNLLLDETPRYTMTEAEKNECGNDIIIPNHNLPILASTATAAPANNSTASAATSTALTTTSTTLNTYKTPAHPYYDPAYLTILDSAPREMMNYSEGTVTLCLNSIVRYTDSWEAKDTISAAEAQQGQGDDNEEGMFRSLSSGVGCTGDIISWWGGRYRGG